MKTRALTRQQLMAALLPAILISAPAALLPEIGWSQQIEEVTVTARRREENVQDIPVAVAAFDADFIEKQGVVTTEDVVKLVPGVQFDQGFSAADTRISIRGINNSRGRSSVAMLIDGIDVSGENVTAGGGGSLLNTHLLDLERIEVVKGPQSALYGRNAFAGAINYVTRKPSLDELYINVAADAANYDTYNVRGAVSGPVTDTLALGFNAASYNTDGYFTNPVDGSDLNGGESNGARFSLLWAPTDAVEVNAAVTYSKDKSDPRAVVKVGNANQFYLNGVALPAGTTADYSQYLTPMGPAPGNMDYGQWLGKVNRVSESDINLSSTGYGTPFEGSEDERWMATLDVAWDLDSVTFKSITSYLDNDATLSEDVDFQDGLGTPLAYLGPPVFYNSLVNDYNDETDTQQFTQDFILQSNSWDRGTWLVGAQYFSEDVDNKDSSLGYYNDGETIAATYAGFGLSDFFQCGTAEPVLGGMAGIIFQYSCTWDQTLAALNPPKSIERDTKSYSVYGLVSYDFTEKFSGTFEARYIKDEIKVTTDTFYDRLSQYLFHVPGDWLLPPGFLPTSDTNKTSDINPRVALDYRFTDDVMVYGSAAKGTKPGGFGTSQMSRPQLSRMEPETLYAYEIGTKTTWKEGTLRANAAIFYNDYKDRQVGITVIDPLTQFPASGIVNAAGAETKGFEIDLLWLATEHLTLGAGYAFTDAEWTDFNYSNIRANGPTVKDKAICGNDQGDCSGADIAGIPEDALTFVGNYTAPISGGDLEWFINAVGAYQSERAVYDRVNTAYIDSSWKIDAQLGLQTDVWSVMLFSTNLLDDETVTWGQGYQDFRDGMYGGLGGQPRDESVMAFLPDPRIVGVRASWKFGN